jgi:hypothetical protein
MTDLVSCVVQRGVVLQPGVDQNGIPHWAAPGSWVQYGPGDTVMLPPAEADRLRQLGVLAAVPQLMALRRNAPAT